MEISVIQIAIAIAIVLVCGAIAACKVIDARAEARRVSRSSFMAGLKDLEEIQKKTGSLDALIPSIEEAAKVSKKVVTYQEAIFAEQLINRITVAGLEYSKADSEHRGLTTKSPKNKIDAATKRLLETERYFLNAIDAAAYWYLQEVLPTQIFEKYFLGTIKHAYVDSSQARRYTNIQEVVAKYDKELLVLDEVKDK